MASENKITNGLNTEVEKNFEDKNDGNKKGVVNSNEIEKKEEINNKPRDIEDGKSLRTIDGTLNSAFLQLSVSRDQTHYNMNHARRGHCLIFNHSTFDSITKLNDRNGTDRDREHIKSMFGSIGFDVSVFNNFTVSEIKRSLDKYADDVDHSNCDCLAIFFLSHGEEGHLYARNELFKAEDLFTPFMADNCPSLTGKPKMFFIQACRGEGLDPGVMVYENKPQVETDFVGFYKIPTQADFLTCWSTIPGHFSWRNTTNGSWFIQSLISVFHNNFKTEDVLSMMTLVNHTLTTRFESNCPSNSHMHGMKQSAYLTSTLTRKIFLKPKK